MKKSICLALLVLLLPLFTNASLAADKVQPLKIDPTVKLVGPGQISWFGKAGVFGSAARIGGGFERAVNDRLSFCLDTGYGIGNNYMLAYLNGGLIFKFQSKADRLSPFAGIAVSYSHFSNKVIDVPGINNIEKGGAAGLTLTLGVSRADFAFEVGYDSRTGYLGGIKFGIGR